MLRKFLPVLLCNIAPGALLAQQVELRSSDEFISVEGEIIGFNGVMLSVETSVGQVSVPASEVICYGEGCLTAIANPDFGLTEAAFDGVEPGGDAEQREALTDDFVISFESPRLNAIYRTITSAFAVTGPSSSRVQLGPTGQITLQNEAGNETATVALGGTGDPSDLQISTVSLRGTAEVAYPGPMDWVTGTQLTRQLVGLDAFAVIAASNVGIDSISVDQLADIYAGDLTNWSQLGGADLNILPLQLPANSPLRNEIVELIMEPRGKSIASDVLTMADEAGLALSVNQFPGSVSVVSVDRAADNNTLSVSGSCAFGVAPTPFNIVSGDYPLIRPAMVTYDRAPNTSLLTALFDSAATDTTQDLLAREDLSKHGGMMQDSGIKNTRLNLLLSGTFDSIERPVAAEMFQVLFEADRLSPTMSGGAASAAEGALNRAMMHDLTDMMRDPEFAGREVIFAGFGDSINGSQDAIDASARAAADMLAAFRQFATGVINSSDLTLTSFGFGNVSPATCYEGQVPGQAKTRVEVWVR